MALATVFRRSDDGEGGWRLSLTARILAVNIFALIVLAGGFFYLDSFRTQLLEERTDEIETEVQLAAAAVTATTPDTLEPLLQRLGHASGYRFRFYQDNKPPVDGWSDGRPTYILRNPADEPWRRHVARFMDRVIDHVVGAEVPELFIEPKDDRIRAWPEAMRAAIRRRFSISAIRSIIGTAQSSPSRNAAVAWYATRKLVALSTFTPPSRCATSSNAM